MIFLFHNHVLGSHNIWSNISIAKVRVNFLLESGKNQVTTPTPMVEEGITEAGNLDLLEKLKASF